MSSTSITGLLIVPLAFFACGLLISLYVWIQARKKRLVIRHQPQSIPSKRDFHTPTIPGTIPQSSMAYTTPPAITSRFSWSSTCPTTATQDEVKTPVTDILQKRDTIASINLPPPDSFLYPNSSLQLFCNNTSSFQTQKKSTERSSVESQRVWLQPLPLVWKKKETCQEQRVWRNSSGGSSYYSRPASWYSTPDTRALEEARLEFGLGAGPGPTIRIDQATAYRYKPLPPLPI